MVVSLLMMIGRTGSLFGNLLFPWLLSLGCLPPFLTLAGILLGELNVFDILKGHPIIPFSLLVCGLLCLALPKSAQVPLK